MRLASKAWHWAVALCLFSALTASTRGVHGGATLSRSLQGSARRLLPHLSTSAAASAEASATATATAAATVTAAPGDTTDSATSSASATADVNTLPVDPLQSWDASVCLWSGSSCALNPAYLFSLPTPRAGSEKLLLQITAMRYSCLNHTDASACATDTDDWCNYDDVNKQCRLQYDDADFVGMLLWSTTRIACKGSRLAEIVSCSSYVAQHDCTSASCEWGEQACYPAWYSGMAADAKLLATFKSQVHAGSPEVWGDCLGAQLYKRYAAACDYPSASSCSGDKRCTWIAEYDAAVGPNPLNFSKQCTLATSSSPIETVYLGPGSLSGGTITAQNACTAGASADNCSTKVVTIAAQTLVDALSFKAGEQAASPQDAAFAASEQDDPVMDLQNSPFNPGQGLHNTGRAPALPGWGPAAAAPPPADPVPLIWAPAWVRLWAGPQPQAAPAASAAAPAPAGPLVPLPVPTAATAGAAAGAAGVMTSTCRAHFVCSAVQRSLWKLRRLPVPPLS